MLMAGNDEEKRSRLWWVVTLTTSLLIVMIGAFFVTRMFRNNPISGTWSSQDSNMILDIETADGMTVRWADSSKAGSVSVRLSYTMDRREKTVSITVDGDALSDAVEQSQGELDEDALRSELSTLTTTFEYSVEGGELTLTEREYGDQLVFSK